MTIESEKPVLKAIVTLITREHNFYVRKPGTVGSFKLNTNAIENYLNTRLEKQEKRMVRLETE
ncbi:hypothetical protein C8P64_1307 [Christiangramia gaetbulicola]|uniref:Uncharacterized protein n=1 Tax=Christiangramia gaetbulicola TaxID=703340 RepID=A0A2T6ANB1_9FLAO|nr:hypothetical protein C8P64_1307 [Christiangramia gaetbulicola]